MRVRTGFVSNSSSVSFTIYGLELNREKHLKKLAQKLAKTPDEQKKVKNSDTYKLITFINDKLYENKSNLTIESGQYQYNIYIGASIFSQKMDETKREFMDRIALELTQYFDDDMMKKLGWYEESWFDG